MPQRFLRPGITTSDAWNAVSFEAQSFYIRILTLVDDFGRYDGRLPILHGQCFALRTDITPKKTAALRSELHEAYLIQVYESGAKEFIQVERWSERARSDKSKFPDPPLRNPAESCDAQEKGASLALAITSPPSPLVIPLPAELDSDVFRKAWKEYLQYRTERKLSKYTDIGTAKLYAKLAKWGLPIVLASIDKTITSNWQGLFHPDELRGGKSRGLTPSLSSGEPLEIHPPDSIFYEEKARLEAEARAQNGEEEG